MYIILGATGHVGSATTEALLDAGQAVTAVTRDASHASALADRGAGVAVVDIGDPDALRDVLRSGKRALLLNPPASPSTDTDTVERESVRNILTALAGSGLEKVVAGSTYGAQPGERLGDLNTLHDLEAGLAQQPVPFAIIRAAFYYSNWDALLNLARESGALPTMFPADLKMPMVAPADLGRVAARLLMQPVEVGGIVHVEGPAHYAPRDVANAFAQALARPVVPLVTPRAHWKEAFRALGFSDAAAQSYARMTAISVDGTYDKPRAPIQGRTTLAAYVEALAARDASCNRHAIDRHE